MSEDNKEQFSYVKNVHDEFKGMINKKLKEEIFKEAQILERQITDELILKEELRENRRLLNDLDKLHTIQNESNWSVYTVIKHQRLVKKLTNQSFSTFFELDENEKKAQSFAPPQYAEYLIYLLIPKNNREAVLGDLEEDFHAVNKKFGLRKAQFLYWFEVIRSIWPFVVGATEKLIKIIKFFQAAK